MKKLGERVSITHFSPFFPSNPIAVFSGWNILAPPLIRESALSFHSFRLSESILATSIVLERFWRENNSPFSSIIRHIRKNGEALYPSSSIWQPSPPPPSNRELDPLPKYDGIFAHWPNHLQLALSYHHSPSPLFLSSIRTLTFERGKYSSFSASSHCLVYRLFSLRSFPPSLTSVPIGMMPNPFSSGYESCLSNRVIIASDQAEMTPFCCLFSLFPLIQWLFFTLASCPR